MTFRSVYELATNEGNKLYGGVTGSLVTCCWGSVQRFTTPDAERTWGHMASPGPAPCIQSRGESSEKIHRLDLGGGKGRLLLLVLFQVFLD